MTDQVKRIQVQALRDAVLDPEMPAGKPCRVLLDRALSIEQGKAVSSELDPGTLSIENGYLVRHLNRCTCSPYGSSHEPHCGMELELDLSSLPGWPGKKESHT